MISSGAVGLTNSDDPCYVCVPFLAGEEEPNNVGGPLSLLSYTALDLKESHGNILSRGQWCCF